MLVFGIAIEEMAHFLMVQNILLSIGAEPYLRRQDQAPDDRFDPFPFVLQRAVFGVVACYVSSESPSNRALNFVERLELRRIRSIAKHHIQSVSQVPPGVPLINRVGALYEDLLHMFSQPDANDLFIGLPSSCDQQASVEEPWAHGGEGRTLIIRQIKSRSDVIDALKRISEQGEGFENGENSHFIRFRRLYRGMRRMRWVPRFVAYEVSTTSAGRLRWIWRTLGVFDPALQILISVDSSDASVAQLITLLNLRYQLILLTIREVLERRRQDGVRIALINLLMREMSLVLPPLATAYRHQAPSGNGPNPYMLPLEFPALTQAGREAQMRKCMADSSRLAEGILRNSRQNFQWNVMDTIAQSDSQRISLLGWGTES
jgi:hypothetical protein